MKNLLMIISNKFLTIGRGKPEISGNREISTSSIRETESQKLVVDSIICPYCASKNIVKRGWRKNRLENVQLLQCNNCQKTFTPQTVKGKHYPLATIFDAVSLYNLGYSLEESCRVVNEKQNVIARNEMTKQSDNVDTKEDCHASLAMTQDAPRNDTLISPSTLSNWLTEFKDMMPYVRLRNFALQKHSPKDMVITATLAHRQLYRFRFHRAKCQITMQEHFHHASFSPLKEFLEMIPSECPHQYFQDGLRASEAPLAFSKTAMIIRSKQNFATKTAAFVLQSVKERTQRHEAVQKFMLYNDSVTVATEVPVYLTRDDIEHMQTQLGFEIFTKPAMGQAAATAEATPAAVLPKLITGHIDFVQIRNGMIHLLDFKPNAAKERPIEQLTLYAMALSRLTGLRLFEFKCAWFDEKDYFEFYPLHVLHKTKKAVRRKQVKTKEGTYAVNKEVDKIKSVRPI